APDPDDHRHARVRHGADRARAGPRLGLAWLDRARHHRRAGALAAHHAPHHAGRVLAVRRPGALAAGAAPVAAGAARQLTDGPSACERRARRAGAPAGRVGGVAGPGTARPAAGKTRRRGALAGTAWYRAVLSPQTGPVHLQK